MAGRMAWIGGFARAFRGVEGFASKKAPLQLTTPQCASGQYFFNARIFFFRSDCGTWCRADPEALVVAVRLSITFSDGQCALRRMELQPLGVDPYSAATNQLLDFAWYFWPGPEPNPGSTRMTRSPNVIRDGVTFECHFAGKHLKATAPKGPDIRATIGPLSRACSERT